MRETRKAGLSDSVKSALTEFPYCVATYIALFGIAYLILQKWL